MKSLVVSFCRACSLTQDFGENEDKNHADEQPRLLSGTSDTSITDDADGETGRKTSEADGETSAELDESSEERSLLSEVVGDQDGHDQTVDGNDTSHNDGNDVWTNSRQHIMYTTTWFAKLATTQGRRPL